MSEQPERLRTAAEWSKDLGCSVRVILYAIKTRKLLATRAPFRKGHPYLIATRDVKHWLDGLKYGRVD